MTTTVIFSAGCRSCPAIREFQIAGWEGVGSVDEILAAEGWKRDRRGFHYCPKCELPKEAALARTHEELT